MQATQNGENPACVLALTGPYYTLNALKSDSYFVVNVA